MHPALLVFSASAPEAGPANTATKTTPIISTNRRGINDSEKERSNRAARLLNLEGNLEIRLGDLGVWVSLLELWDIPERKIECGVPKEGTFCPEW